MKYDYTKSLPLYCKQTQSMWYKYAIRNSTPIGILLHDTAGGNPKISRYVQPSDDDPAHEEWLKLLGKNPYNNDWNHIEHEAGLNCWIGQLADGSVATVQAGGWDIHPWGCGNGKKGSCNGYIYKNGVKTWVDQHWLQFEICDDGYKSQDYFNAVYKEACEVTAYFCKKFSINPLGKTDFYGTEVPTIICHQDAYKLQLGGDHGDIYTWFKKFNKTMDDFRNDVKAILDKFNAELVEKAKQKQKEEADAMQREIELENERVKQIEQWKKEAEEAEEAENAKKAAEEVIKEAKTEEDANLDILELDEKEETKLYETAIQTDTPSEENVLQNSVEETPQKDTSVLEVPQVQKEVKTNIFIRVIEFIVELVKKLIKK